MADYQSVDSKSLLVWYSGMHAWGYQDSGLTVEAAEYLLREGERIERALLDRRISRSEYLSRGEELLEELYGETFAAGWRTEMEGAGPSTHAPPVAISNRTSVITLDRLSRTVTSYEPIEPSWNTLPADEEDDRDSGAPPACKGGCGAGESADVPFVLGKCPRCFTRTS